MNDKNKTTAKKPGAETVTKPAIDWERVEIDYRLNVLSLREIAAAHPGLSHMAIARKAKACGWVRNLAEKIAAKADEIITRESVTAGVTKSTAVTDRDVVNAAGAIVASIRVGHRKDIARFRALVINLLAELEDQTEHQDLYKELADVLEAVDDDGKPTGTDKLNDIYRRVIAMPQRVDSLKKLSETLKVLIALEREAYGIGASADEKATKDYDGPAMSAQDAYMRMIGK